MYCSLALSPFTVRVHHHQLSPECFHFPKPKLYLLNTNFPFFLHPPAQWHHYCALRICKFDYPGNLYQGNHVVYILLWLTCFAQHNIFKVLPCCMRCQNSLLFIFLRLNDVPFYVYTPLSFFPYLSVDTRVPSIGLWCLEDQGWVSWQSLAHRR